MDAEAKLNVIITFLAKLEDNWETEQHNVDVPTVSSMIQLIAAGWITYNPITDTFYSIPSRGD